MQATGQRFNCIGESGSQDQWEDAWIADWMAC